MVQIMKKSFVARAAGTGILTDFMHLDLASYIHMDVSQQGTSHFPLPPKKANSKNYVITQRAFPRMRQSIEYQEIL